jgi:hypothetical protein
MKNSTKISIAMVLLFTFVGCKANNAGISEVKEDRKIKDKSGTSDIPVYSIENTTFNATSGSIKSLQFTADEITTGDLKGLYKCTIDMKLEAGWIFNPETRKVVVVKGKNSFQEWGIINSGKQITDGTNTLARENIPGYTSIEYFIGKSFVEQNRKPSNDIVSFTSSVKQNGSDAGFLECKSTISNQCLWEFSYGSQRLSIWFGNSLKLYDVGKNGESFTGNGDNYQLKK